MFCQKCGYKLSEDAKFCGSCGSPTANPQSAQQNDSYYSRREEYSSHQQAYYSSPRQNAFEKKLDSAACDFYLSFFRSPMFNILAGLLVYMCIGYFIKFDDVTKVIDRLGEGGGFIAFVNYVVLFAHIILLVGVFLIFIAAIGSLGNLLSPALVTVKIGAWAYFLAMVCSFVGIIYIYADNEVFENVSRVEETSLGLLAYGIPVFALLMAALFGSVINVVSRIEDALSDGAIPSRGSGALPFFAFGLVLVLLVIFFALDDLLRNVFEHAYRYSNNDGLPFTFDMFVTIVFYSILGSTAIYYDRKLETL